MDWWQTFFDDQYLKMYGVVLPEERTEQEVAGILAMLGLSAGASVLDLCCGQGRHALRMAQVGLSVTGLDLSPTLLAIAEQGAEAAGVQLTLVRRDMRDIPFENEFDAIVNMFTAFGYFDSDAENERVLQAVRRALKPGGQLLIDLANVYRTNSFPASRIWYESDAGTTFQEHIWDPWTGRDNTTYYWFENGERKSRSFSVRAYASYEMVAMLQAAGLTPLKLYGGFDMSTYNCRESRRLIVLARKEDEDDNN
jgi:SAM-dependent methyltransferase